MSEQERQKSSLSPTEEDELIEITTHLKNERALAEQGKPNQSEDYRSLLNALVYRLIQQGAPDEVLSEVRDHECTRFELRAITEDRDALAAELKALREQEPIGYISPKTSHWLAAHKDSSSSYGAIRIHCSETDSQTVPLYAHPVPARELTNAADSVLAERRRQIEAEGYSPDHDDEHTAGELAQAAADLCVDGTDFRVVDPDGDEMLGWGLTEAHRSDRRRQLVIAGALVLAEIERIDRAHIASKEKK